VTLLLNHIMDFGHCNFFLFIDDIYIYSICKPANLLIKLISLEYTAVYIKQSIMDILKWRT